VLVVREVLELPELTAELQAQAAEVLQACSDWRSAQESELANRLPPEDPRSEVLQQEAAEVAAVIAAAQQQGDWMQAMPVQQWPGAAVQGGGSSSGNRLEVVKGQVLAEQAAAAAAAARAAADAEAKAAAEAAAKRKPYK
jgi:hypothetical protein